jgi:hypothetical protein
MQKLSELLRQQDSRRRLLLVAFADVEKIARVGNVGDVADIRRVTVRLKRET